MKADRSSQDGVTHRAAAMRPSHRRPFRRLRVGLSALLACTAVLAALSLLLEHGFYPDRRPIPMTALRAMQIVAAALFAADRIVRLVLASPRWAFLKEHWAGFVLLAAAGAALAFVERIGLERWFENPSLAVVQLYLVGALAARAVELNVLAAGSGIHPTRLLVGSFLFLVFLGAGLLMLPRAVPQGQRLYPVDALFTATSATCVTGLTVKDTGSDFTLYGQTVILCLIQLGGLGIMIFSTIFALFAGRRLGLRGAAAVSEMISHESVGRISRMVKFIVLSTLLFEAVGALLLLPLWKGRPEQGFAAVFHSVSAFCNAGFALQKDSFIGMRDTWQVLALVPALIILGGLGFPVLYDLLSNIPTAWRYAWRRHRRNPGVPRPRLTLHTKVVLVSTLCLLAIGAAGLLLMEPARPRGPQVEQQQGLVRPLSEWQAMNWPGRIGQAWFQSVTARTAGFNTVEIRGLSQANQFWIVLLMLIGGSPAGTAGGMKTVTFAVLVLLVWSMLRRRQNVEMFGRSLTVELVRRALTLAVLFGALVTLTTLLLCVTQQGIAGSFMDRFFESASACGTVGLSTGETARLTTPGKYVITAAMFVGRIGPLTLLMGLLAGGKKPARYSYPNEGVIIG